MKIIFLEAVQNFGGARKSTVELAARIKSTGHEVLIVDFWGSNLEFNKAVKQKKLEFRIIDPSVEPFVISNKSKFKLFKNNFLYFFKQIKYRRLLDKIVEDYKPDIVCVNNLKCLNILRSNSLYKIDYIARGWFSYRSLSYLMRNRLKRFKPRFIAVSQSTRQAIYTGGITNLENIKVLTDVINTNEFYSYQPTYKKFSINNCIKILHSGGFIRTKGQHICLEIARELLSRNIHFKMTLTGIIYKGDESQMYYYKILDLIKEYKLEQHVTVIVNPTNIIDYFKNTDILVHPSYTEGLPRVCLEALAFGKPVIANPVGGITDVVIHGLTGYLSDFNSIEQYSNYIEMYYNNLDLYKSHSIVCRQMVENNYLDNNQIESIKRIYKTTFNNHLHN